MVKCQTPDRYVDKNVDKNVEIVEILSVGVCRQQYLFHLVLPPF